MNCDITKKFSIFLCMYTLKCCSLRSALQKEGSSHKHQNFVNGLVKANIEKVNPHCIIIPFYNIGLKCHVFSMLVGSLLCQKVMSELFHHRFAKVRLHWFVPPEHLTITKLKRILTSKGIVLATNGFWQNYANLTCTPFILEIL